jgi:hypothetical protein
MLGHQGLSCLPRQLNRALGDFGLTATDKELDDCFKHQPLHDVFADQFLRFLGANQVVSVDRSDFEGANLLHDLNEPFPESYHGFFDYVIDGGTLEHIFNYPSALRNVLETVAVGGHFLTVTPATGVMGHGFYQFSPELLFRVFSAANGFELRKIVIFDISRPNADFFEVHDPAITGLRTELSSSKPMHIGALARRTEKKAIFSTFPQQSDYFALWERHRQSPPTPGTSAVGLKARLRLALDPYLPIWIRRAKNRIKYRVRQGSPSLSNKRQFRRLSWSEIFAERAR